MKTKIMRDYIINLSKNSKRVDGRKLDEMRNLEIITGLNKNAEGSAEVKLGNTHVIAGVKLGLGVPFPDTPDKGVLMCGADLVAIAAPEFESGPPSEDAIEVGRVVDRGIREGNAIDLEKLCITPEEKVWMVFVDVAVINHDGNLIDACGIAGIAALLDAKMPYLDKEGNIDREKENKGKLPLNDVPIPVTVRKANGQLFVDTNAEEEDSIDARMTITTKRNGNICSVQKGGVEPFTVEETARVLELSQKIGKAIRSKLKA